MTGSDILDRYFGVHKMALGAQVQRYALLAGLGARSDAQEQELDEIQTLLDSAGLQIDIAREPRRTS